MPQVFVLSSFLWQDDRSLIIMITAQVFVLTNGRPLICLHCTETYIMCGEEKTGRLVVYNRLPWWQSWCWL